MTIAYKELVCPLDIWRGSDAESGDVFKITHLITDEEGKIIRGSGVQTRGDHGSLSGYNLSLSPEEVAQIKQQEAVVRKSHR